jgi:hypothetical protein
MMNFNEYLLREYDDPRLVKKYTEKPGPALSARKASVTTGKVGATKHTGPTAAGRASNPGEDRVLSRLRDARFAGAAKAAQARQALKKRSAILAKRRPAKR